MNNAPDSPQGQAQQEDAIDLGVYRNAISRARRVILSTTVVLAVAAGAWSLLTPRMYQASLTLAVSQSNLREISQAQRVTPTSFKPIIESATIARAVVQQFGLDKAPYMLTPATFGTDVLATVEVTNTSLINLNVRLDDPELAAKVANRVAALAVEKANDLSEHEAATAQDLVKKQLDEVKRRYDEAATRLKDYRNQAQIEGLKQDVEAVLGQRSEILSIYVRIGALKARIARSEQELNSRLHAPTLNEQLDRTATDDRVELAELERKRVVLVDERKLDARTLPLLSQLYERELGIATLEMELKVAEAAYTSVAARYETSRLLVAGRSTPLSVFEPALPPERPLSRNVIRNTALFGFIGFALSVAAVILVRAYREVGRRS